MKKYNIINNTLGWLTFVVAAVTYLLTLEPTASFWDCPEFISQGYKLEIGHPPGNPMFILAARFAANFAGSDVTAVSWWVNAMSALFSAGTILLLFWTITHLVKQLVVKRGREDSMTLAQYLVVMGSGLCGALVYTWSDTFWFSAVEAEVYAFSSFCTALVFWLILKWENRAGTPAGDRYLILIAYVFGVSLGVHLLNLLAIPAIALIFYYRYYKRTTLAGSIVALLVSFAIIVLILYGLEPGFVELAGYFELLFVNGFGMGYNSGVLFYAVLLLAVLAWCLFELHRNRSDVLMRLSFVLGIVLSGMLFLGNGLVLPVVLIIALSVYVFVFMKRLNRRLLANTVLAVMMIFIGFSSYALVLIRADANTPLNENAPNSPFALTSYLSRDQYGKAPLVYGETPYSRVIYDESGDPIYNEGPTQYTRVVDADKPQYYSLGKAKEPVTTPELNMLLPRIYSSAHIGQYTSLMGDDTFETVEGTVQIDNNGNTMQSETTLKPTVASNLSYFFSYQINYMYWRYFMWNFAGRQNDLQGDGGGDLLKGNWITGIAPLDDVRLGDQDMLPDEFGAQNKGHNVFFLLPLLLGIIGLVWQAFAGKRGIEQFWVVFFLFFMTGLAIVLYLNQTPAQPRERDYAYAGSFYAFAIWVGMGVAGLWRLIMPLLMKKGETEPERSSFSLPVAALAAVVGILVPLQMVSQTWDDHDRSGRTCARDFGMNYLSSVDENGIIFCNGDNDTFPLWYAQEVEGYRTDVRVVNLSYLATDWYIHQMRNTAYNSAPLPMVAGPDTYAYGRLGYCYVYGSPDEPVMNAAEALRKFYDTPVENDQPVLMFTNLGIPVDAAAAVRRGVVSPYDSTRIVDYIPVDLKRFYRNEEYGGMAANSLMSLDLITSSVMGGWKRPIYFAMTVPGDYYLGLEDYLRNTGMAYQVTPVSNDGAGIGCNSDKMYKIVTEKFLWGGLDKDRDVYLDETVARMVTSTRSSMLQLVDELTYEARVAQLMLDEGNSSYRGMKTEDYIKDRYDKALNVLKLMETKLPEKRCAYQATMGFQLAQCYDDVAKATGNKEAAARASQLFEGCILRYAQHVRFYTYQEGRGHGYINRNGEGDDDATFTCMRVMPQLLYTYKQSNEQGYETVMKKMREMKLPGWILNYYKESIASQEEYERRKAQHPAAVATPDSVTAVAQQ